MKANVEESVKDAYIYGYPIVGMYELLYTQVVNKETRKTGFNEFAHTAEVASPKTSFIPAPNNDTTYSRAWLDLREEPAIIDVPDTDNRYYSIQLLNLFSETLTNVGRRTTGTEAKKFAVVGPNWNGELSKEFHVIKSDTTFVLAFLRILINDETDIPEVKRLQDSIKITTLSGRDINETSIDNLPIYKNSNNVEFFETLEKVLELTSISNSEVQILDKIKEVENKPKEIIDKACEEAKKKIEEGGMKFGENVNFWRIARKGIGNYGSDYMQRSVVWHKGALANQVEESLYPSSFQDNNGELLDGEFNYKLTFTKEDLPQVSEFWSLTMYKFNNAFLYDNEIDRYSIGDRTKGLVYDNDGSLTIYIQNEMPTNPNEKANWLPAPKEKFFIVLRLYGPNKDTIEGIWKPTLIQKVN